MGTAQAALIALAAVGHAAAADPCTGVTHAGARFATCFDLGNRLSVTAGSDGFGGSIAIRHDITFDDEPDLVWKLDHDVADATYAGFADRFHGVVYRGRFVRHSRDGHIVLPLGSTPQKVFLPFDIGALVEVGNLRWQPGAGARLDVIKTAALVDFARSRDFRQRLAFGPSATWEVDLQRDPIAVTQHVVSPFSSLLADLHLESVDGLYVGDLRAEAGMAWHTTAGWQPELRAEAAVERILLAINDRPIALVLAARYDSATAEATAGVGVRIVLFHRLDPRVSLHPPR